MGIPTECVGGGIYDRVILYGTLPLIIIFLMPFGATLFELGRRKYSELRGEDVHKRPIYFIFLEALPLSLFVAFVSVIAVSKQIFSVFDCTEFQTDSRTQPATTRSFIASQLTIECSDNPEYMSLRTAAYVFGVIWPVGMPILFILATVPFRRDHLRGRTTPATKATMFLHKEYEPAFYWWEPLALLYRLGLIGYVQLIPSDKKLIRLLVGLIISIIYSFLIVMTKPFAADQVDTLSIATQICLVFMFLAVTVLQIYDSFAALGGDLALKITGFSSREQVGVIIIVFLVGVFIVFAFMLISDALKAQTRLLLLRSDSQPPNLSFEKGMRYHLFLSHVWSSAQDQVAVIKRMMQLLMPGVQIFLDVDDLEDIGNLAKYAPTTLPPLPKPCSHHPSLMFEPLFEWQVHRRIAMHPCLPVAWLLRVGQLPQGARGDVPIPQAAGSRARGGPRQGRCNARGAACRVRPADVEARQARSAL